MADRAPRCAQRVCILTESFYPMIGGGETQSRVLAEDLRARGIHVLLVTRRSTRELKKKECVGGIPVYRLAPTGKGIFTRWRLVITSLWFLVWVQRHYDVVFVSGFKSLGIPAVLAAKLFRKGCVLKADSNGEMSGEFFTAGLRRVGLTPAAPLPRMLIYLRNALLRQADGFVAISDDIAAEFIAEGISPQRIHILPNSVDTDRFKPVSPQKKEHLRQQLGLPLDRAIVTYTGRLVSYKGLPRLLKVWRDVACQHARAFLLLVGTGSLDIHNCEAELRAYVHEAGLDSSVLFTGDVRQVEAYLQASDLFVFPTEKEAFGISLIEAMACGLPVIATRVGGIKRILSHGYDGLAIESGNSQQLRESLLLLLTDEEFAASLGTAARDTVLARYARELVAMRYVELLTNISQRCSTSQ